MRIAIASRIFEPEPSAASFRLAALASAFTVAGHEVTVLTVRPPHGMVAADTTRRYRVRRSRVLRDRSGYVRGYLPYLSFDVPLFLRLLFGRRVDLLVAEPPPTTGLFVRIAAAIRRTPYVYYAADIWSDASAQTGAPGWVVKAVRSIERFALRGAQTVLSVSDGVTRRLDELGVKEQVVTVGNGIDTRAFRLLDRSGPRANPSEFVYAGTASEWHGAEVFVEALPSVLEKQPDVVLRFIGGGSEREALEARAAELGIARNVSFEPVLAPTDLAPILAGAAGAVASVRPESGYDFAFPTKLYSAAACGAPLIYSGMGPAVPFVQTEVGGRPLGIAVGADPADVAQAMLRTFEYASDTARRLEVADWAAKHVSIASVAELAVRQIEQRRAGKN